MNRGNILENTPSIMLSTEVKGDSNHLFGDNTQQNVAKDQDKSRRTNSQISIVTYK